MLVIIATITGLLIGFGIFAITKKFRSPIMSDEERSRKFQAHIQGKIAEIRKLQEEGADKVHADALIARFEATGMFDHANLLLKSLINTQNNITDEKERQCKHQELLELVKEVNNLHKKNLLDANMTKTFLSLADQQFKNEMTRIASKTLKNLSQ